MPMNRGLLGVVLCGGRSSRMGCDKAMLAHPDGGTFLEHAIDRLTGICHSVVISGGTHTHPLATLIEDSVAHRGPATGISASLEHAAAHKLTGCLITPVDLPDLTETDLISLRDQWNHSQELTMARTDRVRAAGRYLSG